MSLCLEPQKEALKPGYGHSGFVVRRFVDLTNWKAQPVTDLEWQSSIVCPIDGGLMFTVAELASQKYSVERVRIGCCDACGHVAYIDRPSDEAVDDYYRETWMGESVDEVAAKARQYRDDVQGDNLFDEIQADRSLPALEVGCGYGANLRRLELAGFKNIVAQESCPNRAAGVSQACGVRVYEDWPNEHCGLISFHHVLEHVADVDGFIARCATLQQDGDYLLLSVPDFKFEPSMGVLLFWPHLHSFSRHSLYTLLAKHGYGAERIWEREGGQMLVIARKGLAAGESEQMSFGDAVGKLRLGLGITQGISLLTWQRDFEGASLQNVAHAQMKQTIDFPRSMEIQPVPSYLTGAPIELQFPEHVEVCFK